MGGPSLHQLVAQAFSVQQPAASVSAALSPGPGLPELVPTEVARTVQQPSTTLAAAAQQAPQSAVDPRVTAVVELLRSIAEAFAAAPPSAGTGGGHGTR